MKKSSLRSLAIGFLASALLTGGFAVLVQGHTPTSEDALSSLFKNDNSAKDAEQYKKEVESLQSANSTLEATRKKLNESLASLKDKHEKTELELSSLKKELTSTTSNSDESSNSEDETSSSSDEDTASDESATDTTPPEKEGSFTISAGENSDEIANNLEAAGFIDSAEDFKAFLDEWGLNSVLQADTYELNSNMSYEQIAELITHGVFYYE